jgi:glycosyltransferase involved in cell wall biosynthesis
MTSAVTLPAAASRGERETPVARTGLQSSPQGQSICIVSHNAYGAISGRGGFIGGVERQTSVLARWLAERGHRVSFLTWDEGGPAEEMSDGVRVIKLCRQDAGLPGLRFFHPKWSSLNAALRNANADVYYHNCGECVTGQIALWCRRNRRAFVFSAASNADCDPRLPELKSRRERTLYRWGLRHADRVITQTLTQQRDLREHFGRESEVVPMPCPGPDAAAYVPPRTDGRRVLWIGRVCRVKRPDRLVEVAAACPDVQFDMAGPVYEDAFSREAARAAGELPNVTVHGAVPRELIGELYRQASLLCNTSDYEGFPNTFLEAWSHGLPVVSSFDPDSIIRRHDLGLVVTEAQEMAAGLRSLLDSPAEYLTKSGHARRYYESHHTVEAVLPQIEALLLSAARR